VEVQSGIYNRSTEKLVTVVTAIDLCVLAVGVCFPFLQLACVVACWRTRLIKTGVITLIFTCMAMILNQGLCSLVAVTVSDLFF
jgi:hypothetical protein